ncbi:MAG: hypothetical protein ACD_22C00081G0010 [uncultured bacterium]|nr:MAG: hypothetical protein ACD_22C00081G0010 [uncultured bacterium]
MSNFKLTLGYLYPDELNLYGDNGNVEILVNRAQKRNIAVEVVKISPQVTLSSEVMGNINMVFMGGGPDSGQKIIYEDFYKNKGPFIKDYIESGGYGLYICGSYQLLGHYYKSADETILKGVGAFDLYTQSFGNHKPRCIGNVVCEVNDTLANDPIFKQVSGDIGNTLVGFENHGGRTYLGEGMQPFAKVQMGFGNNSEDGGEGVLYKNSIGSYLHGPILARNPHLADYLIAKALNTSTLEKLDDTLIISAHTASKKLKQ